MLRHIIAQSKYCIQNRDVKMGGLESANQEILGQRVKIRKQLRVQHQRNLPAQQYLQQFNDSIVKITLYMKHDCWRSQFVYLLFNYHKLGFRRISDLVFLDRASYFLQLRKKKDEERWPSVKVVVALDPKIVLTGIDPIVEFFKENQYFDQQLTFEEGHLKSVEQFIEKDIVYHLQSVFWHPLLTFQYTFHTNASSYSDTSRDDMKGILGRNSVVVISRIVKNIGNIIRQYQRYRNSKDKLQEGLKQLTKACLSKHDFIGGDKPGRLDFYLMAHLRTKQGSKLFINFLEKDIGKQFWMWWVRVSSLCRHDPERITTL